MHQTSVAPACQSRPEAERRTPQAAAPCRRRALLAAAPLGLLLAAPRGSGAAGLDSLFSLPQLGGGSGGGEKAGSGNAGVLAQAEEAFQSSPLLQALKERTTSNSAKNKRDLTDKYCYRQAELGVGDCAGLRLIPGMTKSGAQKEKTPERRFIESIFGGGEEKK